jgi:signal transduction histidine kinase
MTPVPDGVARPVPWVAPVLYLAVLAGGLYYGVVGDEPQRAAAAAAFTGGLALLLALEFAERRRYPLRTPARPAIVFLAARAALFVLVTAGDAAGLSRALFVLVPFTAYFAFGRTAAIALGVACAGLLTGWFAVTVPGWYADDEYVSDLLMFGLGLALAISMAAVAVGEQAARVRQAAYAERVAELSADRERTRLAREIHDSLGHHLTAIAIQLEKARAFRVRDPGTADQAVADAQWSADRALDEVRQSVRALRDAAEPFSLSAALTDLVRHIDGNRLTVTLDMTGAETGYAVASLTALYRAAQEGLTNAYRHAHAAHAAISVSYGESSARLVVTDDGRGLPGPATSAGFGLRGMRERIELIGGHTEIESEPGAGTVITVTVPRLPAATPEPAR